MFRSVSLLRLLLCGLLPWIPNPWSGVARAQDVGVLVRLEPGGQPVTAAPEIRLAPLSGEPPILLTLNDDGTAPDVVAGDGRWAGVAMTSVSAFKVSVSVGADTMDAGEVSWPENVSARDLVLTLMWGGVTAEAGSPENPAGTGPIAGAQRSGTRGAAGTAAGAVGGSGSSTSASVNGADLSMASVGGAAEKAVGPTEAAATWVWVALGGGVLALLGGVSLLVRGRAAQPREVLLDRAPEPPLFGPGSPSVQTGLSVWQLDWAQRADFLAGLLATLARHHRVLYVVAGGDRVPMAFGGPVYVCHDTDLRRVDGHLEAVLAEPGLPLVVLFVDPDPSVARVRAMTELLAADVGGVLVTARPPAELSGVVAVQVRADGAVLTTAEATIELELGRFGYVPRS